MPQSVIEMLRRGMGIILFQSGQDHHPRTSCLEPRSMQSCDTLRHASYPSESE